MLIETKIEYTEEKDEDIFGDNAKPKSDEFLFDLSDVSGIMPGNQERSKTIIFLHGRDILIQNKFNDIKPLWIKVKSGNANEG